MTQWESAKEIEPHKYTCSHCHCGRDVGSNLGFIWKKSAARLIYLCPYCDHPTYFTGAEQIPSPAFGEKVEHLPANIEALYGEARKCTSVGAFTATVLACRKILMHIAVDKGAKEGQSFLKYVDYLADAGHVPPGNKGWVDLIRTKGNEANHEIVEMKKKDAEDLVNFLEMLLKFMYEFPGKLPSAPEPKPE